ncbi:MAG: hypothetical protein JJT82_07295 [Legionellaceae bacterium]|nr:hypothetical protein [Legionellaceae bacterium]
MRLIFAHGYSFANLLMGVFLSLILSLLALQHYLNLKQHYRETTMQLNASLERSFSLQLLRHSLFHAGFTPCGSFRQLLELERHPDQQRLSAPISILPLPQQGITIRRMSADFFPLQQDAANQIRLPLEAQVHPGDYLIISNCHYFQRLVIDRIYPGQNQLHLRLHTPIHSQLQPNASVGLWIEEHFYIEKKGLYYHHHKPELLSPHWQGLPRIEPATGMKMLHLSLIDRQGKTCHLSSATPNA